MASDSSECMPSQSCHNPLPSGCPVSLRCLDFFSHSLRFKETILRVSRIGYNTSSVFDLLHDLLLETLTSPNLTAELIPLLGDQIPCLPIPTDFPISCSQNTDYLSPTFCKAFVDLFVFPFDHSAQENKVLFFLLLRYFCFNLR